LIAFAPILVNLGILAVAHVVYVKRFLQVHHLFHKYQVPMLLFSNQQVSQVQLMVGFLSEQLMAISMVIFGALALHLQIASLVLGGK